MSFDPRTHFQQSYNKRRIHVEQLRSTRNNMDVDDAARRRLDYKIDRESQQLDLLSEIWDVT